MSASIENFDFEEEPSSVSSTSNPSAKEECLKKIIEQHFDEEIAYKQLELNTIDEVKPLWPKIVLTGKKYY